jgi:hypothetical protein
MGTRTSGAPRPPSASLALIRFISYQFKHLKRET